MPSQITPHVFMTRFNLPANRVERSIFSPEWLEGRMHLFEAYTVPSVRAQTREGLGWVVYLDQLGTPDWLRARMAELSEELPLRPIYLDRPLDRQMIHQHVREVSDRTDGRVITSNLDNDDGLAADFVDRVRQLTPSSGTAALYLVHGLILHREKVYLRRDPDNAFSAVVDDIGSADFRTCWAGVHNQLESLMPALRDAGPPGWLQVVHGANVSNRVGGRLSDPATYADRFPGLIEDLPPLSARDRLRDLAASPCRVGRDRLVRPAASALRRVVGPRRFEAIKLAAQRRR